VLNLLAPFSPERYISAIELCEKAGMEGVIIDSATHEWENLLEFHGSMAGNSYTNWNKITPRHNAFVQSILQTQTHIICTMRSKQDYVLNEKNGRMVPEKVGLKSIQREGMEYEFTLVFDLDMKNMATASKDRTGLFYGKPAQILMLETGKSIKGWCESGAILGIEDISARIGECQTIDELINLYKQYPASQQALKAEFQQQKRAILLKSEETNSLTIPKLHPNGTSHP
jgi:hypothetical protein